MKILGTIPSIGHPAVHGTESELPALGRRWGEAALSVLPYLTLSLHEKGAEPLQEAIEKRPLQERTLLGDWEMLHKSLMDQEQKFGETARSFGKGEASREELAAWHIRVCAWRALSDEMVRRLLDTTARNESMSAGVPLPSLSA